MKPAVSVLGSVLRAVVHPAVRRLQLPSLPAQRPQAPLELIPGSVCLSHLRRRGVLCLLHLKRGHVRPELCHPARPDELLNPAPGALYLGHVLALSG